MTPEEKKQDLQRSNDWLFNLITTGSGDKKKKRRGRGGGGGGRFR